MEKSIKLILLGLLYTLVLSGCAGNEEYIDNNAWRDKLIQPTDKEITIIEDIKDVAGEVTGYVADTTAEIAGSVSSGMDEGAKTAKNTAADVNELLREQSDTSAFANLGKYVAAQIREWGSGNTDNSTNTEQPEVNVKDTTLSEDSKKTENGRIQVDYVRAVDGDTIIVEYQGKNLRVRLIGINTQESVHPDAAQNNQEGIDASNFTKDYLKGTLHIWLELDNGLEDDYGRTLAYVWLNNTGNDVQTDMLNGVLLKNKYAEVMTMEPNTKYVKEFEKIAAE